MYSDQQALPENVQVNGDRNILIRYIQNRHEISKLIGNDEIFVPANVDDVAPIESHFLERVQSELVPVLQRHRIVVLGGHRLKDKDWVARYLAWYWRELMGGDVAHYRRIQEWNRTSPNNDVRTIGNAIRSFGSEIHIEGSRSALFLFPDIEPRHFGFDMTWLSSCLQNTDHYAIVTTDYDYYDFDHRGNKRLVYWMDMDSSVYDGRFLRTYLENRLRKKAASLPAAIWPAGLEEARVAAEAWTRGDIPRERAAAEQEAAAQMADELVPGLSVGEMAARLQTPMNITYFVDQLCSFAENECDRDNILLLSKQASAGRRDVNAWFRRLDRRRQLLALGLLFSHNLLEDQVFSVLEFLVKGPWRERDPQFSCFDYYDIQQISSYFVCSSRDETIGYIHCLRDEYRGYLLEVAWELHRRHILATLPYLVDKVVNTRFPYGRGPDVGGASEAMAEARIVPWISDPVKRELFSTGRRHSRFCHAVGTILGELGRFSINGVEPAILAMAQDGRVTIQYLAAAAMASWRESRGGMQGAEHRVDVLCRHLEQWFTDASHAATREKDAEFPERARANVRATIALAVEAAARYDRPDELAHGLYCLLMKLIGDPDEIVRDRLCNYTLPRIIPRQLGRLYTLLWQYGVRYQDLIPNIAESIALACQQRPREAMPILLDWYTRGRAAPRATLPLGRVTLRETQLATAALADGYLSPDIDHEQAAAAHIIGRLGNLLSRESHPYIRSAVLMAMMCQAERNFDKVAPYLSELLAYVNIHERGDIIARFTHIYLRQRQTAGGLESAAGAQPTGPEYREKTAIEAVMEQLIRTGTHPGVQQCALATLHSFAAADRANILADSSPAGTPAASQLVATDNRHGNSGVSVWMNGIEVRGLSARMRGALVLAFLFDPPQRARIEWLLPQYLECTGSAMGRMPDRMLADRLDASGHDELRATAHALKRAEQVYRHWPVLVWTFIIGLFLLLMIGAASCAG